MSARLGPAWVIVNAMAAELRRQTREGTLLIAQSVDDRGGVVIEGRLDLAALAHVTEMTLRDRFGK